jgi:predicted kinase
VARLRQALDGDLREYPREILGAAYLIVLSGLPGTGKSHFASELARQVPVLIVGSDRMRKALVARPRYTRGEHARVFAACHQLIDDLLQEGYRVVFDATNLTEGFRAPVYEIARSRRAPLAIIWFTAPIDLIRRRLDDRAAGLSVDSHSDADWRIHCRLRPGEEPISRPHLKVDSSRDITPVVAEVVGLIQAPVG